LRISSQKYFVVAIALSFFLAAPVLHAARVGDLNGDDKVGITDAIVALKAVAGMDLGSLAPLSADVNGDVRIGLEEALYALQSDARLRNYPTIVPIGDKSLYEGQTLFFTISASDPEGEWLWFFAENVPSGAIFDPYTPSFSWTPASTQSGTYQVTFLARDTNDFWASETVTITVNELPRLNAPDYFPLQVGNWWKYLDEETWTVSTTSVSDTKSINGTNTFVVQYPSGEKEYYTSDVNGMRLFGVYLNDPDYTGDIFFNPPLLLAPNNAAIGSDEYVASSSYSIFGLTVYITSRTMVLAIEDVVTENRVLKNCIKTSVQISQIVEGQTEPFESETTYYWFHKGVGVVKQIDSWSSMTIKESFVNGVHDAY